MPSPLISFCLCATFDTLLSSINLKYWRLIAESSFFLCGKNICTSAHILGVCKIAPHQGHFSLNIKKVLCELVVTLQHFLSSYKPNKYPYINFINLVREGLGKGKNLKLQLVKVSLVYYTQPLTGI